MPFLKWLSPFLPNTMIGVESMQATTNNERIARKLALDFISNSLGINGANLSAVRHEPIDLSGYTQFYRNSSGKATQQSLVTIVTDTILLIRLHLLPQQM